MGEVGRGQREQKSDQLVELKLAACWRNLACVETQTVGREGGLIIHLPWCQWPCLINDFFISHVDRGGRRGREVGEEVGRGTENGRGRKEAEGTEVRLTSSGVETCSMLVWGGEGSTFPV